MADPLVAPVYRAHPRCLYKDGAMVQAVDQADEDAKLADGWQTTPIPPTPDPIEASADDSSEDSVAPSVSTPPTKRGRPPKRQE